MIHKMFEPTDEASCIYQFITNNYASCNLRWKENLLNHEKVSKYYNMIVAPE